MFFVSSPPEDLHLNATLEYWPLFIDLLVPTDESTMENIMRYSGGGGAPQRQFIHDVKAVFAKMMRDPNQHILVGLCQYEFLKLLGSRLTGEARQVLSTFLERYDFEDPRNPILDDALDIERRRQLWREFRRDTSAWSLNRGAGGPPRPVEPVEHEPADLGRFFDALEARFKTSTTENLSKVQSFKVEVGETPERMFCRFNQLVKPLEDERPPMMTVDQLKTTYVYHLHTLLDREDSELLAADCRVKEHKRENRGRVPLSRWDIHNMILQQQREKVIADTRLHAVGLATSQKHDRTTAPSHQRGAQQREGVSPPAPRGNRLPDTRACHLCGQVGHLARSCLVAAVGGGDAADGKGKRPPPTPTGGNPQKRPVTERLGQDAHPPVPPTTPREGGDSRKKVLNLKQHQTKGAICAHCKKVCRFSVDVLPILDSGSVRGLDWIYLV